MMDVNKILAEYDSMFGRCKLTDIEKFLANNIEIARDSGDYGAMITLLNEIIGFCRDTTQRDKALSYCDTLLSVMNQIKLQGRVEYATSLLNIANAYRAFGLCKESLDLYQQVYENYKVNVEPNAFAYASLYNNWSLVYQEMEDFEKARDLLLKALAVVDLYEEAVIPQANTRTNLATTLLQIGTTESYAEAMQYLSEAIAVYERDGGRDFHYGAALVAMGDAYFSKHNYNEAAKYYQRGMNEIEKHVGKTDNYARVLEKYEMSCKCGMQNDENINKVAQIGNASETATDLGQEIILSEEKQWITNLERCRDFYIQYGKPMIHQHFAEYEDRIAVGLAGEGSDCFEFDDHISTDHDYGLGFCMWLTQQDYDVIGLELQKKYEELILLHTKELQDTDFEVQLKQSKEIVAQKHANLNRFLSGRRGVFTINGFVNQMLGIQSDFEKNDAINYPEISEEKLATVTNGAVFFDKLGIFSGVRERIQRYYPDNIWRLRLAQSLHEFAQYGQSNYSRMMARKDYVTAKLCISKAVESAMDLVYLLNKTYAPYYKWKKKGLAKLSKLQTVNPLLEEVICLPIQKDAWMQVKYSAKEINQQDQCVCKLEQIAQLILEELRNQDLVTGNDTFLERYCSQIIKGKYMDIIDEIVELEWNQFDKVKNEGGRADCQDDFATFSIMRKSQYMTWNEELLISYRNDLLDANQKGWNLIMEKYARMMKSTAPGKYAELEKELPELSEQRIAIQEEIVKIQVTWMEQFANEYPKMAGNARSIHTSEDNEFNTSYETYLRGELGTYSELTFVLYGRFITGLMQNGKNLAYETMKNTAHLYGYESVELAEKSM